MKGMNESGNKAGTYGEWAGTENVLSLRRREGSRQGREGERGKRC